MGALPKEAERFTRSDFITFKPGPASKILPRKSLPEVEEFFCPACGIDNPPPVSTADGCRRCDLRWVAYGNALYLWRKSHERHQESKGSA